MSHSHSIYCCTRIWKCPMYDDARLPACMAAHSSIRYDSPSSNNQQRIGLTLNFCRTDTRPASSLSRRTWRRHNKRMDGPSLPTHTTRTHYHECGVGPENATAKIQFPRHRFALTEIQFRVTLCQLISFWIAVVWNPWSDQAREIGDFGDDEYPNMLCVEAGHVSTPVILLPGTAFEASQILQVSTRTQTFPIVFLSNEILFLCVFVCCPFHIFC